MKLLASLLAWLPLAACAPQAPPAAPPATATPAVASVAPEPEAPPELPAPRAPANLLDLVAAKVAVSSTVVNPHDFPEHLVDGKPDTAWNSRSGDLRGWIAFRVPADAHVDRIEITAGYDKVKGKLDLFTENHRITRLAVSHDGAALKEVALDPERRGLQVIPIDGPGGEYRIQVLATLPGTTKEWRELTVSELRVVGTPGREARRLDQPLRVAVGDLDAETEAYEPPWEGPQERDVPPQPTVAALCAAHVAAAGRALAAEAAEGRLGSPKPGRPWCSEVTFPAPFTPSGPFKSLHAVRVSDGFATGTRLVVEGPRGFEMAFGWNWDDPRDPGCPSIVRYSGILEARVDNGHLVVVAEGYHQTYVAAVEGDDGMRMALQRVPRWAKIEGGRLHWRVDALLLGGSFGWKVQPTRGWTPWGRIPWSGVRPFHVTPDGSLRIQG